MGTGFLKEKGFNILVDGSFGPKTCKALSEAFAKIQNTFVQKLLGLKKLCF